MSNARPASEPVRRAVRESVRLHHRDDRSDAQLWKAWMQLERPAIEELFKRYHPRACALASAMRLSDEDAQDIAQETMLGLSIARWMVFGRNGLDDYVCNLAAGNVRRRRRDNLSRGQSLLAFEQVGGVLAGSTARL